MGRFLLLIVGALALSVPVLLFQSAEPATAATEGSLWQRADRATARELALSGIADAETKLSLDFARHHAYLGPATWASRYGGGAFDIVIERQDSLVIVTSRGAFRDAEHHVRRAYRPSARAVPPFVRQALLVENHIQIAHPLHAWATPPTNANVHSNRHLMIRDLATVVTGFGTASGRLHALLGVSLPTVFTPNYNPDALVPYSDGAARVPIPTPDVAVYRPLASSVFPRRHTLSGRIPLGTRQAPVVLYADGDLGTGGPVEFDGWGVLVVNGAFQIDHALRTVGDANRSRLLVIVEESVQVRRESVDLAGSWVVGQHLSLRGGTRLINGGFTVGGHFQTTGAVEIGFMEVPIQLVDVAWPDYIVARSYREW